jgi:AraC-like DNA-binding protein
MREPTFGAGYAKGLLELAASRGADRRALAARAGLDLATLENRDNRIPWSRYVALMREAKATTGEPALALHYGEAVDIAEISIIGLINQASETVAEAFAQLNRYVPLIAETENAGGGARFQLMVDRSGPWTIDARLNANDFPELTESAFAQLVCAPRRAGEPPFLKAVHVTWPDPGYRAEYERVFQAPVVFGSDRNGLLVDPGLAGRSIRPRLPRYAFGVLCEHADALLASLEGERTVRGQVEALLLARLHTGEASMDGVAGKLGMSRQTLFRRLKAEGVTFEEVLDAIRHKLALEYLRGRKVSVNETAYLVGFSDPAAFSRAFKRWTGSSPRDRRAS